MESQTRSERGEEKNLTPNWKRPLTCAIFLPGSSAKNKTVQTLGRGRHALEFSVCRKTRKKRGATRRGRPLGRRRPRLLLCPGREKSRAPRCPLLSSGEGRLHNFVRESSPRLGLRLLLPVLPRRRRPLCWRARVGRCLVSPPPRERGSLLRQG